MHMPHVPLSFDAPEDGDVSDLLECSEHGGLLTVRWAALALTIVHSKPKDEWEGPDLEDVEKNTPGFRAHGLYGFTLGQYTEVLSIHELGGRLTPSVLRMGNVEVTLGQASPLARYLFDPHQEEHVHGEWEGIWSMRLWMCPPQLAEAYLLEGHAVLTKRHGLHFNFCTLDFSYPDEENTPEAIQLDLPPAVTDIEPLRLYHSGYTQSDATTAILQFYRVLEYYSVVSRYAEVETLRRQSDLTSRDFTIQVARIIGDEDRASVCRLVGALADGATLQQAVDDGLIDQPTAHILGNKLYDFRNSIVHAKHDNRTPMFVPSIFSDPPELAAWRRTLDRLARSAIDVLGARSL